MTRLSASTLLLLILAAPGAGAVGDQDDITQNREIVKAQRYAAWSNFKPGTRVRYVSGRFGESHDEFTLLEAGEDKVVLARAFLYLEPGAPDLTRDAKANLVLRKTDDRDLVKIEKEGEEELQFNGKKYRCRWIEGIGENKLRARYWLTKEVPGGILQIVTDVAGTPSPSKVSLEEWSAK